LAVRITTLQSNDLPALRELYLNVRQATFAWFDTTHYQLADFDTDTIDEFILVAYVGNKIAGFVSAYIPENFIHHLYVDAIYQKQGVGTALLNAMLEKLKFSVSLKCLENNKNAIAFYERHGFKHVEKGVSVEGVYILLVYEEVLVS